MAIDGPRLRSPFNRFPFLANGSTGLVFQVNGKIVVKTVWRYENNAAKDHQQESDSFEAMRRESGIYDILCRPSNWHQNLVLCFVHTPFYLFLERQAGDLFHRVIESRPVSDTEQYRWMYQISAATAWLEHLRLIHGDLRPINILLDNHENVKLCDFDNAYRFGEDIVGAHQPYYKIYDDGSFGLAGVGIEQYAVGSCFYFILMGDDPSHSKSEASNSGAKINNSPIFSPVIRQCWDMDYGSLADLNADLFSKAEQIDHPDFAKDNEIMGTGEFKDRVDICNDYLVRCQPDFDDDD